jgi:hypothetical protein
VCVLVSKTDWLALASLILSGTVRWIVPQLTQTNQASSGWSSSQRFFTSARSATVLSVDLLLTRIRTPLYISSYHHQLPRLNTDKRWLHSTSTPSKQSFSQLPRYDVLDELVMVDLSAISFNDCFSPKMFEPAPQPDSTSRSQPAPIKKRPLVRPPSRQILGAHRGSQTSTQLSSKKKAHRRQPSPLRAGSLSHKRSVQRTMAAVVLSRKSAA